MCLAVPGKIIQIYMRDTMRMCKADFGGITREACIETLPEAKEGDYIIVHAGFALNILSPEEAEATLQALEELSSLEEQIRSEDALS
ncbi:MAG: HypC/HybG/HupF family hydrogenase formation chaperone [Anaerolineae bacterium]|nr:HypC/HybG/HupF family hydrogenase formation chaperone [Anaerolineae bacterium]